MTTVRDEAGLTFHQREVLRAALEGEASTLAQRRRQRVAAVTTHTTDVMDDGDLAARAEAEDVHVRLAEAERVALLRINAALDRLARGTFGLDVETGEPIGYERLKVVPWATRAAHHEERRERAA